MSRLTWKRSLRSFDSSWMETLKSASSLRISSKSSALLPSSPRGWRRRVGPRPHQLVQHGLGICSILCAYGGQLGRLSIGCAVWVILLLSQLFQQRATLDIGVSQRKVQAHGCLKKPVCAQRLARTPQNRRRGPHTHVFACNSFAIPSWDTRKRLHGLCTVCAAVGLVGLLGCQRCCQATVCYRAVGQLSGCQVRA